MSLKNFFVFIGGMALAVLLILFHAWVYMMAYELAFIPFINYFTTAPQIPYSMFILLNIGIGLCRAYKKPENNVNEKEFWTTLMSSITTKLVMLLILWGINSIVL